MKKLYLLSLLLLLTALACYQSSLAQATIPPTAAATVAITSAAIKSIPSPAGSPVCIVRVKSLNVRASPESDVIAWLYLGDPVTILEDAPRGEWIHIQADFVTGWIHSRYCTQGN